MVICQFHFPQDILGTFLLLFFPLYLGFISFCRGSAACETLAPLQCSRGSLAAASCPQPEISVRMERLENQQPGLLQNLSWLLDAK